MPHKKKIKEKKSSIKTNKADKELHVIEDDIGKDEEKKISIKQIDSIAYNELKNLVEKNIKWSQVIYNQNKKIKHRLTIMVIASYIKIALIIIPIILGIIFLPPLLGKYISYLGDVMNIGSTDSSHVGTILKEITSNPTYIKDVINQIK